MTALIDLLWIAGGLIVCAVCGVVLWSMTIRR